SLKLLQDDDLARSAQKKRPRPLAEAPGVGTKTDWVPLLPCEGWFGQTQRKRWVMDDPEGSPVFLAFRIPNRRPCRGKNVTQRQGPRACGGQAAIPVGLLIGLPKSGPQSRT